MHLFEKILHGAGIFSSCARKIAAGVVRMRENRREIFGTIAMAAIMLAAILLIRARLVGWLLPDASTLEALAQRLRAADAPIAQTVFAGVREWFGA